MISEILYNTEVPVNPTAIPPIAHLPEGSATRATLNNAKLYVPSHFVYK